MRIAARSAKTPSKATETPALAHAAVAATRPNVRMALAELASAAVDWHVSAGRAVASWFIAFNRPQPALTVRECDPTVQSTYPHLTFKS